MGCDGGGGGGFADAAFATEKDKATMGGVCYERVEMSGGGGFLGIGVRDYWRACCAGDGVYCETGWVGMGARAMAFGREEGLWGEVWESGGVEGWWEGREKGWSGWGRHVAYLFSLGMVGSVVGQVDGGEVRA